MTVVATAIPVTLPVLRERLTKADTTPALLSPDEVKIDALLGDMKIPEPELKIIIDDKTYKVDEFGSMKASKYKPVPLNANPVAMMTRALNRSERLPEIGPNTMRIMALGSSIIATCRGLRRKAP
tara:strand:+ start:88 stop:462 length:375 start_codon:yes stop_codon:yes gene_type:complete